MKDAIMSMLVLVTISTTGPKGAVADHAKVLSVDQKCCVYSEVERPVDSNCEMQVLERLVEETFVNGALNRMDTKAMFRGFHRDFAILIPQQGGLMRLGLSDWVKVVETYKKDPAKVNSGIRKLDFKIDVLDITGRTAVVKVRFFRIGELVITDYLSYIKYPDGWQAVSKVSHEHINNPLQLDFN